MVKNAGMPIQGRDQNVKTAPQQYARTLRSDFKRVLTTGFGGQFMPVMAVPLLREDRMLSTTYRFALEMAETSQMLLNPVRINVSMWFVPKLAFARFLDLGHLNRSYMQKQEVDASTTEWFDMIDLDDGAGVAPVTEPFFKMMGMHTAPGVQVNSDYLEAYNAIWNYVAAQTSPSLTARIPLDTTIAPAFWDHTSLKHVKPTFDQALIHGEFTGEIEAAQLPVTGIGLEGIATAAAETNVRYSDGTTQNITGWKSDSAPGGGNEEKVYIEEGATGYPAIFAEMAAAGVTVSLANMELAKKTAAFARARQQYQGLNDDDVIDLLMAGVRLPEEGLQQPILLGEGHTIYGMSQRFATDAANLDKSVTEGRSMIDINVQVPQVNTGGIVMGIVQILPEQLYERQEDQYLVRSLPTELPDRLSDELDLEPVETVTNKQIDTDHTVPAGTFGYAPLNHRWQRDVPNIGGLFYRPRADEAWNENRDRIWAVETIDPTLGDDFYLASNIHHQVFADGATDPFEVSVNGLAKIEGLTFFGPGLRESEGDFDKIAALVDDTKIVIP